ncbi:MAG: ABC transporter permease [Kordiimonadaceae bacterium]|nr:ABC transporter permease [Kordiimonadaceae bacterium]MBO6567154.1 ABC transporter permease [Kordiimonadaceae bacterium]MBO6963631.1 ABC transporter permease [Kordiimonadaceae bacterium]
MLKNYLITALRNLLRHKLYSFINIGGLSLGLAACLMIFLFVQSELSYDKWLPDNERIYRLEGTYHSPGKPDNHASVSPGAVAPAFKQRFPNMIEDVVRLLSEGFIVKYGETRFIEDAYLADPSLFDILDLPMVAGDRERLFDGYDKLIISERIAEKYFGDESPIGKVMELDGGQDRRQVVAVMQNLPDNTHLDLEILGHFNPADYDEMPWIATWWISSNVFSYYKLTPGTTPDMLAERLPAYVDANAVLSSNWEDPRPPSEVLSLSFVNIGDIHLSSPSRFQMKPTGDIMVVYSFTGIAALILVIAIINFTNLSTARASLRAQEIALRKVVGATRRHIVYQFLGEAVVTVVLASMLAFAIVEATLPWFNAFVEKLLDFNVFTDPQIQIGLLGLLVVVSLGAGAHPALRMSSFRPARVLHSKNAGSAGSVKIRAILTTVQFTISIGLMITTGVIYSQLNYARSMDVGFDKDHKMQVLNMSFGPVAEVAKTIQQEVERLPGVNATAFSDRRVPLRGYWDPVATIDLNGERQTLRLESVPADTEFLEFMGAKLLAGRLFDKDRQTDVLQPIAGSKDFTQTALINETTAAALGFANVADAIGLVMNVPDPGTDHSIRTEIIGVVQDMHLRSVRDAMDNSIFVARDEPLRTLNVDIGSNSIGDMQQKIEEIWNRHIPEVPFSHRFVDESYNEYYEQDARRGEIFAYFSAFAILVSCLGLYGLASFTAERRVKEIGVRKVMGATVSDIVKLLTFQFSKPVLLANLIAWPVAWFIASDWLQGFQYRIDLSVFYFISAGAAALLIACATVAGHAFRTAQANPVVALKHE